MPGPTLVDGSWKEAYCYGFSVYFGMKTWDLLSGTPKDSQGLQGTPDDFCFPSNHSHFRIPKDMGIVWEAYHKGVPCPSESLESPLIRYTRKKQPHYDWWFRHPAITSWGWVVSSQLWICKFAGNMIGNFDLTSYCWGSSHVSIQEERLISPLSTRRVVPLMNGLTGLYMVVTNCLLLLMVQKSSTGWGW